MDNSNYLSPSARSTKETASRSLVPFVVVLVVLLGAAILGEVTGVSGETVYVPDPIYLGP